MIFNSFTFLAFFALIFVAYWLLHAHRRAQNRLLLVASYVFYGYWDWRFLSLIAFSTLVDYVCGLRMADRPQERRFLIWTSLCSNLGLLFVFKYFEFFEASTIELLNTFGMQATPLTLDIVLPVGISFYTFQTLSYTIDIYRGRLEPCRNFLDFALFVSFFPQLVAGPIERAVRFIPQIQQPRRADAAQMAEGAWLVMWGYFKKVFIADNVAGIADVVFSDQFGGSGGHALIGVYAFAIQIYCDFSGYSDIARGISKLLGFELMVNFDLPYFARNPSDFWRRWHISLSTWLRDYLYISLGGNRVSTFLTYRNLMLTMLLGGLWHGAAWTFVVWGAFHGGLLALHRWMADRGWLSEGRSLPGLRHSISVFLMFHAACLGWIWFRAESMGQAFNVLGTIFGSFGFDSAALEAAGLIAAYAGILVAVQIAQYASDEHYLAPRLPTWAQGAVFGLLFYLVAMYGAVSDAFIYFQF